MEIVPTNVRFEPVGRCIYCTDLVTNNLTKEHIIPLSFGGNLILPKASCKDCAAITGALEGKCCSTMFKGLRVHQQVPTRNPKRRPTTLKVLDGQTLHSAVERDVPVDLAPGVTIFPIHAPPGLLSGDLEKTSPSSIEWTAYSTTPDFLERGKALWESGYSGVLAPAIYPLATFERVLAKIAHSFMVAYVGYDRFQPLLPPIIKGEQSNIWTLVGGTPENGPLPIFLPERSTMGMHRIATNTYVVGGVNYVIAQIRLFSHLGTPPPPVYSVIVGTIPS